MSLFENKYLGVMPGSKPNEFLLNTVLFYFIPNIVLSTTLFVRFLNFSKYHETELSLLISFGIVIFLIGINVLASFNVLSALFDDSGKHHSILKKMILFILFQLPFVLYACFCAFYFKSRHPRLSFGSLFTSCFFFIVLACISTCFFLIKTNAIYERIGVSPFENNREIQRNLEHPRVGRTFQLWSPHFMLINPIKNHDKDSSNYAQGVLVTVDSVCKTCAGSSGKENPIRMHLLPKGSRLSVKEAISIPKSGHIMGLQYLIFIVSDEHGHTATLSDQELENYERGGTGNSPDLILDLIEEVQVLGGSEKMFCSIAEKNETFGVETVEILKSNLIKFITDFNIKNEVEIFNFSQAEDSSYKFNCAQIKFKSINSLALFFHFGESWGLGKRIFFDIEKYDSIQKTPLVAVSYQDFLRTGVLENKLNPKGQ